MGRALTRRAGMMMLVSALFAGCSDDTGFGPDPAVTPFVGDWEATALVLSSPVAPDLSVDLIEQGSTFNLNVQPSGTYTAILVFFGQAQTEIGQISVAGQTVTLNSTFPTVSTEISTYVFEGPDRLILDGDTEFDFNLDGTPDDALAHFELQRR